MRRRSRKIKIYYEIPSDIDAFKRDLIEEVREHEVQFEYPNKDTLELRYNDYKPFGFSVDMDVFEVEYFKYSKDEAFIQTESWQGWMLQRYPVTKPEEAINAFIERLLSETADLGSDTYPSWENTNLFIELERSVDFKNHYDYLDHVIDSFWKKVFGKTLEEMWCSGIITAHGDKAYGYKYKWSESSIPFNRGVLLYLLSYTPIFEKEKREYIGQWVIDQYQTYLPLIEEAEKEAISLNKRIS